MRDEGNEWAQALLALEEQGWQALATPGEAGRRYYAALLAEDAVMLFPGGVRLDGKEAILDAIGPQPWRSYQLEEARVLPLGETAGAVIYRVTAQHAEGSYAAQMSSIYVWRDGAWRLVLHQQTSL